MYIVYKKIKHYIYNLIKCKKLYNNIVLKYIYRNIV